MPSIGEITDQLKVIEEECEDKVWLMVERPKERDLANKIFDLKKRGEDYRVYDSKTPGCLDVQVPKEMAKKIVSEGLESLEKFSFTVHERNFRRKRQGGRREREPYSSKTTGGRGDRGDRGDRRGGRGRREPNLDGKKKSYVDKETGQAPENRKNVERKIFSEAERKYSRKEAEQRGFELGEFRKTPLEQRMMSETDKTEERSEKRIEEPKKKPEFWSRKDTGRKDVEIETGKRVSFKPKDSFDDVPRLQQTESTKNESEWNPQPPIKKKYSEAKDYREKETGSKKFYKPKEEAKEVSEPVEKKKSQAGSNNHFAAMMSEDSDN